MGMQVAELRQRLGARLQALATEKDPQVVSTILEYARATLIALTPLDDEAEVDLEELTVNTATAAQILSYHPEYVRQLIRLGALSAAKENGEYAIKLTDVIDFHGPLGRLMTTVPPWPGIRRGQRALRPLFRIPPPPYWHVEESKEGEA